MVELYYPLSIQNLQRFECRHFALVYQIRNAFAHDIAEPKWKMHPRYARSYLVGGVKVDLSSLHGQHFNYYQLGGPEALFFLKDFARSMCLSLTKESNPSPRLNVEGPPPK